MCYSFCSSVYDPFDLHNGKCVSIYPGPFHRDLALYCKHESVCCINRAGGGFDWETAFCYESYHRDVNQFDGVVASFIIHGCFFCHQSYFQEGVQHKSGKIFLSSLQQDDKCMLVGISS